MSDAVDYINPNDDKWLDGHYFTPDQLAIRDAEVARRALELAADWHSEEARKQDVYQKQFDRKTDPETKLSHIRDRDKHRDHAEAILALRPAPTGWKLVPEDKLNEIISLDQRERRTVIDADPAGCTYGVTKVDGPCAEIARSMIGSVK